MDALTRNQRGVSLIESMVALLVFLIVAVGWISLEGNLARTTTEGQVINQAIFVAQSQMDSLRDVPFEALTSSEERIYYDGHGNLTESDAEGLVYGIDYAVSDPDGQDLRREVQMTVTWNLQLENQNSLQFSMLVAR